MTEVMRPPTYWRLAITMSGKEISPIRDCMTSMINKAITRVNKSEGELVDNIMGFNTSITKKNGRVIGEFKLIIRVYSHFKRPKTALFIRANKFLNENLPRDYNKSVSYMYLEKFPQCIKFSEWKDKKFTQGDIPLKIVAPMPKRKPGILSRFYHKIIDE